MARVKTWVGATLRHTMTFYEIDGVTPIDPTTLKLRMRAPVPFAEEQVLEYGVDAALVRSAVGIYYIDVQYQLSGKHYRRWEASGNINVIAEEWTTIEPSAFTYLYEAAPSDLAVGSPQLQSPTLTEN